MWGKIFVVYDFLADFEDFLKIHDMKPKKQNKIKLRNFTSPTTWRPNSAILEASCVDIIIAILFLFNYEYELILNFSLVIFPEITRFPVVDYHKKLFN